MFRLYAASYFGETHAILFYEHRAILREVFVVQMVFHVVGFATPLATVFAIVVDLIYLRALEKSR